MNYTDLIAGKGTVGSLLNWVNYAKVPAEIVLEDAQALIWSRLRVREMRTSTTVTLLVATSSVALPGATTGQFLEPIAMKDRTHGIHLIPNRPPFNTWISDQEMIERRVYDSNVLTTADPCAVAIFDEAFQFECLAAEATTYDLVYYKRPDPLTAQNKTNFLTVRWPHLVRAAAEAASARFMHEMDEFTTAATVLNGLCNEINAESDLGAAA